MIFPWMFPQSTRLAPRYLYINHLYAKRGKIYRRCQRILRGARLQQCAGAAKLVEHICLHQLKMFFMLASSTRSPLSSSTVLIGILLVALYTCTSKYQASGPSQFSAFYI